MHYPSMYYVRFSLTYLPTQKSDILYERSLTTTNVIFRRQIKIASIFVTYYFNFKQAGMLLHDAVAFQLHNLLVGLNGTKI